MFDADVVIIGSGPAGFAVTKSLLGQGARVTVVPGGGWSEETFPTVLTGESSNSQWGHEPLNTHRRVAIGGAGDLWGGRSILFDRIDFQNRPWVPHSGWPISYEEYLSFFTDAAKILGLNPSAHQNLKAAHPLTFENSDITMSEGGVELWSKATRFSEMWKKLAADAPNLRLLEGAYCTKISADPSGHVSQVHCVADNQSLDVRGKAYVVAAGALENARLLLNAGYGKSLPALGAYYMSHLWFTAYDFGGQSLSLSLDLRRVKGTYARQRWRISDNAQEHHQTLNAIAFPGKTPANPLSMHQTRPSVQSSWSSRRASNTEQDALRRHPSLTRSSLWGHRGVLPVTQYLLNSAIGSKPPLLLPSRHSQRWSLWFQGEHAPNPSSKVELSELRDLFGNRKLRVDINFCELDFFTAAKFHTLFDSLITGQGLTRYSEEQFSASFFKEFISGRFDSNAHQAGTTRMGTNTDHSVVNSDCRVHSSDNLFVAGSSVFPTSSHANPTLSIIMLSLRLGKFLGEIYNREG